MIATGNTMRYVRSRSFDMIATLSNAWIDNYLNASNSGVLIELHVLGDFPDLKYVEHWDEWLDKKYKNISCYGYTAHSPKESIGGRIALMNENRWDRWSIRFSNYPRYKLSANSDTIFITGITCPEQAGQTKSCGTCGLCWNKTSKPILFMTHSYDLRKGNNANHKPTN